MICIEISGLPLCAWGSNSYKKIASLFSKFKFFKDEESTALSSGRVCISTRFYKQISDTIKVEVKGEMFDVNVIEIGTWNINITDTTTSSHMDVNHLDKDDTSETTFVSPNDAEPDQPLKHVEEENLKRPDEEFKKVSESLDLSRPPCFENKKRSFSNNSKCSTNFARHHKKDIKGRYFTWMNKAGTKLSKLDRFLISERIAEDILDIKVMAIDRMWSDHSPILLHIKKADFGPSPFKFYNIWLNRDGFDDIIKSTWASMDTSNEEVKKAVWECGSNKAPGPDGFSFAFIKKYWDLMKMDIFEFVNSFFAS
nr:RNA-directed DNA polymerase, eukaryota [Tanacetum cinerariifolium]